MKPLLGIFWIHPETKKLIAPYTEPFGQGLVDPDLNIVDARILHRNLWETVKDYFPDLEHLKYDQVPRGRVYFDTKDEKFHVFGPTEYLAASNIQNQIINKYRLTKDELVFEPNIDYELERR